MARRTLWFLIALLAAAFAARLGYRLVAGDAAFFTQGYTSFYQLAERIVQSGQFCTRDACPRPPLYPLLLTPAVLAGKNWLFVIVPQALIGTGTALMAYLIGRGLFNVRAGLVACALAAFHPYYVVHDTALQDTALATFVLALALWLTLRAARYSQPQDWLIAGIALGLALLVRATLAPAVLLILIWIAWTHRRSAIVAAAAMLLTLSPWLITTARITGTPVLTTDAGYELWVGNNPHTFSRFPKDSIDASSRYAFAQLTPPEREDLRASPGNPRTLTGWYGRRALDYMVTHPIETATNALRKIAIAFSPRITPYRSGLQQWAYAASYGPVAILGIAGMIIAWRRRETILLALPFLSFIAIAAVFSAQTSHRVHLDVFWMVFAAGVLAHPRLARVTMALLPPRRRRLTARDKEEAP